MNPPPQKITRIKALITAFLALLAMKGTTQTTDSYLADLDYLYLTLKKTPSFRDQINGSKLRNYKTLYTSLRNDTAGISSDYDIFYKLAHLFFPLRDNHLSFHHLPQTILNQSKLMDSAAVSMYRASSTFQQYPAVKNNLDSLESALLNKSVDSIEGIYYYGEYLKVALFNTGLQDQYVGVVLATTLPHWDRGQEAIRLYEYSPKQFRAVYGHPVFKVLMLYNNEKFSNQSLINSYFYSSVAETVYKKNPSEIDFVNIQKNEAPFQFHSIKPGIQYIRLGNFSARSSDLATSELFYKRIKDSLVAAHLIVDLRNNTGGAYSASKKFLNLIKRRSKKSNIYVIINNGTLSQGERFALRLKQFSSSRLLGQTTNGTIAYGSNSGNTIKLPSGKYQVYITDMKDPGNYLLYESVGVIPDIIFDNSSNWIDKVVQIIEGKNNQLQK